MLLIIRLFLCSRQRTSNFLRCIYYEKRNFRSVRSSSFAQLCSSPLEPLLARSRVNWLLTRTAVTAIKPFHCHEYCHKRSREITLGHILPWIIRKSEDCQDTVTNAPKTLLRHCSRENSWSLDSCRSFRTKLLRAAQTVEQCHLFKVKII